MRKRINFLKPLFAIIGMFALNMEAFCQGAPPPPPGVPLDFGLSAAIAACVGYSVHKMRKKKGDE